MSRRLKPTEDPVWLKTLLGAVACLGWNLWQSLRDAPDAGVVSPRPSTGIPLA